MIVAFNSMSRGRENYSVNMLAAALGITARDDSSVVFAELGFGRQKAVEAIGKKQEFMVKEPFAYMDGEGMDYLMKQSKFNHLSEKNAGAGIVYVKNNLGYVPCANKKNPLLYELEFSRECGNILKQLDKMADYVFVDCNHVSEQVRIQVMNYADLIVVDVSQTERILDEYFSYPPAYHHKSLYCIGNYDEEDPCNMKNIQRLYRITDKKIMVLPYNADFLLSLRKGKALSFFSASGLKSRYSKNREFFQEVFKMADGIQNWEVRHASKEQELISEQEAQSHQEKGNKVF